MKLSPTSAASLHDALYKIATIYAGEEDQLLSTDFYFLADKDKGSLIITDDSDKEIAQAEGTTSMVSYWMSLMPADRVAIIQRKMVSKPKTLQ